MPTSDRRMFAALKKIQNNAKLLSFQLKKDVGM